MGKEAAADERASRTTADGLVAREWLEGEEKKALGMSEVDGCGRRGCKGSGSGWKLLGRRSRWR